MGICCGTTQNLLKYNNDDVSEPTYKGIFRKCKIVNVYDGDTFRVILFLNKKDKKPIKLKIRLHGCDTPELSPSKSMENREEEVKKAKRARNRLIQLTTDQKINIDDYSITKGGIQVLMDQNKKEIFIELGYQEKYGRILGTLYLDIDKRENVKNILINEKHAKPYFGGKK